MSTPSRSRLDRPSTPWIFLAVSLVLLILLATWQFHLTGELSRAEQERLVQSLERRAERFAADLEREVSSIVFLFGVETRGDRPGSRRRRELGPADLERRLADRYARWQAVAAHPDLLAEILVAGLEPSGDRGIQRFDTDSSTFEDLRIEDRLDLVEALRQRSRDASRRAPFEPSIPALVVPFPHRRPPAGLPDGRRAPPRPSASRPGAAGSAVLILVLDRAVLATELLPELIQVYFGEPGQDDYEIQVVDAGGEPIYQASPSTASPAALEDPDLTMPVLDFGRRFGPGADQRELTGAAETWQLRIRHREGSVTRAIARARRHNLGLGLGVLLLLAAAATTLFVSARRSARLARHQLELVASITHELNTPIAAVRSAGQNLADGLVQGSERVAAYGQMIENEGERLQALVSQSLELAGLESGMESPRRERIAPKKLIDRALEALDSSGVTRHVDTRVEPGLPELSLDVDAMTRVLENLIGNALKYGVARDADAAEITVSAERSGDRVVFSVTDRGTGMTAEEVDRAFEPFYRGPRARATTAPGSGLGLHLVRRVVERHGGTVALRSDSRGTAVDVALPV